MKLFYEHYIKLAHIGKGANAHVYKVRHAELGYVRAIKVLNEYIEDKNERVYQSFLNECKTLLTIGNGCHPNIVRIYGPDLIDNHAVVEMDCVQGTTLDSYIKQKGFMDYEEVKTFIKDIVGALAYTHHYIYEFLMNPEEDDLEIDPHDGSKYLITPEKEAELVKKYGIVHNDLHSNNIMRRDYDGRFVLLDFGLAVQDGKCIKSSRMRDGSPEYQAPEKFDSEVIDPRSDVYSLGILMYEVLAGRVPFEIQSDADGNVSRRAINLVLNQHQTATPPPILPFRKEAFEAQISGAVYERDYPEWLDDVVMKCLSKKPEDRYKNAKELLDTINVHLIDDESNNREIKELKDSLAQLNKQLQDEKSRNTQLYKKWQDAKFENEHLLEQQDASKGEYEKIQELKDTITTLTGQWLYEKSEKERLISQVKRNNTIGGGKKPSILLGSLIGILLCCILWIWMYKDSQITSLSQDFTNTLSYVESKGVDNMEVYEMLDSLKGANIELGTFTPQISFDKEAVDSLQTVIASLNWQITSLKKQLSSGSNNIEYRTPKAVQQELNRLKTENKKLRGQVERF